MSGALAIPGGSRYPRAYDGGGEAPKSRKNFRPRSLRAAASVKMKCEHRQSTQSTMMQLLGVTHR